MPIVVLTAKCYTKVSVNEALDFGLAAPAHEVPCDPVP